MRRALCIATLTLLLMVTVSACANSTPAVTTAPPTTSKSASPPTQAPPTTTKPAATTTAIPAPKYGGQLHTAINADIATFDDATQGNGPNVVPNTLFAQELWGGDWTKGPAGGFGTKATDWGSTGYDTVANKVGYLAQSWAIKVDNDKGQGTIVYQIRSGVRYGLNPNSEASKLVNGREMNADDVLAAMKQATTDAKAYIYRSNPELRNIDVSKTGPLEITVKVPIGSLVTAVSRLGDSLRIYPVEIRDKMVDWKNQVGTGPFMLTEYVSGSSLTLVKNPNYWMKDPIGPGKGNQLPYLDGVQISILPDPSTRTAAFRTGKIDQIEGLSWEDAAQTKKEFPQMQFGSGGYYNYSPIYMRTDKAPFSDIRVRQALMMATNFNSIKKDYNGGNGVIITFPYEYFPDYAAAYLGVDDPDLPAAVKQLYTYNPDQAKKLLADAGFANGLKTTIMCLSSDSSYIEMITGMWAKVGITATINITDAPTRTNIMNKQSWDGMTTAAKGPVANYYSSPMLQGVPSSSINESFIDDSYVNDTLAKIRLLAATNEPQALALAKEMTKYVDEKAWAIPTPSYRTTTFWWPWLKNYSGEISIGYFNGVSWSQFIWEDQALKQTMGR